MKIQITKENLINGIKKVERAVGKNATLPIIEHILIKTVQSGLELSSTNLEIGVITQVPAKIETKGEITVKSQKLAGYVNNLPDEHLLLEKVDNNLKVSSDSGEASFIGGDSSDFPVIPKVKGDYKVRVDSNKLAIGLTKTVGAASPMETRPEISGIYFLFDNENPQKPLLRIVGTDSYRLAEKILPIEGKLEFNEEQVSFILPKNSSQEAARLSSGISGGNVDIFIDENQVMFTFDNNTKLISRVIEGNFPNYKAIMPENYQSKVIVSRLSMVEAINRSSFFSSVKTQEINLKIDPKKQIIVKASSEETGISEAKIDKVEKGEGDEVDFNLNYRYLIDGFTWIEEDKVVIEMQDGLKPIVLKPESESDYTYLIMPLRK